jgi:peptide deformylase
MDIIKDKNKLSIPVRPTKLTTERIDEISDLLKVELKNHGDDRVGMAANQLGIDVRMCIVKVKDTLILINPRIISKSTNVVSYYEQCLSIDKSMKSPIQVQRHTEVTIMTDNLGELTFKPDTYKWKDSNDFYSDLGMLESACVQHEIDHLDGIIIDSDLRKWFVPRKSEKTYGRNERVMIRYKKDGTTGFMKYKKALLLPQLEIEIL